MRHSVNKRAPEAQYARTISSGYQSKVVSRSSFLRPTLQARRSAPLHDKSVVDHGVPDDIVRHLSASLAGFEIIIVPGLDGSARHHWQSNWQRFFRAGSISVGRVRQEIWSKPDYESWIATLTAAVKKSKKPVLLVGHSLGSLLIAHAAKEGLLPDTVAGALLVAPADVENGPQQERLRVAAFKPVPLSPLPFPSLVVGSRNDPWLSVARARTFARHWGAFFVDAGRKGHIGNQCDLGYWLDGLLFLDRLVQSIRIEKTGLRRPHKKTLQ